MHGDHDGFNHGFDPNRFRPGFGFYGYDPNAYNYYNDPYAFSGPAYDSDYYDSDDGYAAYDSNVTAPSVPSLSTDDRAVVTVNVPADAKLWFDGVPTQSTGAMRHFDSPPLIPGHRYTYDIVARWNQNGREMTTRTGRGNRGHKNRREFPRAAQNGAKGVGSPNKTAATGEHGGRRQIELILSPATRAMRQPIIRQ